MQKEAERQSYLLRQTVSLIETKWPIWQPSDRKISSSLAWKTNYLGVSRSVGFQYILSPPFVLARLRHSVSSHIFSLFLLLLAVKLLNPPGGAASLAKEVSLFTFHFNLRAIYLAPIVSKPLSTSGPHLSVCSSFGRTTSFRVQPH